MESGAPQIFVFFVCLHVCTEVGLVSSPQVVWFFLFLRIIRAIFLHFTVVAENNTGCVELCVITVLPWRPFVDYC